MAMPAPDTAAGLWLLHWPRPPDGTGLAVAVAADLARQGLCVDTCLRQLLLGIGPRPALTALAPEIYVGRDAWQLTLEIMTGLRSAVPGESNVLGQFRAAWRDGAPVLGPARVRRLAPVIQALLRDAAEIRRRHLQGIGGHSYGSLVRRLLAPPADSRVLFVGSGALTASMLPLFRHCQVGLWSRGPSRLPGRPLRTFAPEHAAAAARWADHLVFTTPPDDGHDRCWNQHLGQSPGKRLVHLGRRRAEPFPWTFAGTVHDLDDVFDLAREQASVRSLQLARARLACAERALARTATARMPAPAVTAAGAVLA